MSLVSEVWTRGEGREKKGLEQARTEKERLKKRKRPNAVRTPCGKVREVMLWARMCWRAQKIVFRGGVLEAFVVREKGERKKGCV